MFKKVFIFPIFLGLSFLVSFAPAGTARHLNLSEASENGVSESLIQDLERFGLSGQNILSLEKNQELTKRMAHLIETDICSSRTGKILCDKVFVKLQKKDDHRTSFHDLLSKNISFAFTNSVEKHDTDYVIKVLRVKLIANELNLKKVLSAIIKSMYEQIDLKINSQNLFTLDRFLVSKGLQVNTCSLMEVISNAEFEYLAGKVRIKRVTRKIFDELGMTSLVNEIPNSASCSEAMKVEQNRLGTAQIEELIQSKMPQGFKSVCQRTYNSSFSEALLASERPIIINEPTAEIRLYGKATVCEFLTDDELSRFDSGVFDELVKVREVRPKIGSKTSIWDMFSN